MEKQEIKKELEKVFYNGKFIEIHSGDVNDLIDLIYNLIQKEKIRKDLVD